MAPIALAEEDVDALIVAANVDICSIGRSQWVGKSSPRPKGRKIKLSPVSLTDQPVPCTVVGYCII